MPIQAINQMRLIQIKTFSDKQHLNTSDSLKKFLWMYFSKNQLEQPRKRKMWDAGNSGSNLARLYRKISEEQLCHRKQQVQT